MAYIIAHVERTITEISLSQYSGPLDMSSQKNFPQWLPSTLNTGGFQVRKCKEEEKHNPKAKLLISRKLPPMFPATQFINNKGRRVVST